jgi:hypothetical protein
MNCISERMSRRGGGLVRGQARVKERRTVGAARRVRRSFSVVMLERRVCGVCSLVRRCCTHEQVTDEGRTTNDPAEVHGCHALLPNRLTAARHPAQVHAD